MVTEVKFEEFPVLETARFVLRELRADDAEAMYGYFSDPEVMKYYDLETFTEQEQAQAMLARHAKGYAEHRRIRWAIVPKADEQGRMIGTIGFHTWDKEDRKAEVGYELDRAYWGQGVVLEAMHAILPFGFGQMELNRVEAQFSPQNTGSRRVLEKAGFQREGVLRDYAYHRGAFWDVEVYSLLKREFVR